MFVVDKIENTGTACPTQWEGETADGRDIYVRYRWGILSVSCDSRDIFFKEVGDGYDGCLTYDQLKENTEGIIEWPEYEGVLS